MKIQVTSVFVDDRDKALRFYTEKLGFVQKEEPPVEPFNWLTVVSPEDPEGVKLVLEPGDNRTTRAFKQAVFEQGIMAAAFAVDDIQREYERMKRQGVVFLVGPTPLGSTTAAVFDDTCGNLIQLYQVHEPLQKAG